MAKIQPGIRVVALLSKNFNSNEGDFFLFFAFVNSTIYLNVMWVPQI